MARSRCSFLFSFVMVARRRRCRLPGGGASASPPSLALVAGFALPTRPLVLWDDRHGASGPLAGPRAGTRSCRHEIAPAGRYNRGDFQSLQTSLAIN